MKLFSVSITIDGLGELTQSIEDRLYEGGCGDALLSMRDGLLTLDFERKASSLGEAVIGCLADYSNSRTGGEIVALNAYKPLRQQPAAAD